MSMDILILFILEIPEIWTPHRNDFKCKKHIFLGKGKKEKKKGLFQMGKNEMIND